MDYAIARVEPTPDGWVAVVERVGQASFPVTVEATTGSGRTLRQTIDRGAPINRLVFPTDDRPIRVRIDPERARPDIDPSNDAWTAE